MTLKLTLFTSTLLLSAYSQASVCDDLPNYDALTKALKSSVATTSEEKNGGLELNMWGSIVARDGTVCVISRTGDHFGDQWPGSRIISAQKANTANSFSLHGLALSTANLWAPTQPGGSLFGLQFSNPVNINVVYDGDAEKYGTKEDSLIGHRVGGVNVFGGGLALYDKDGEILGAIGVSGDTSCADHNIAWKTRHALKLDYVPSGVSETGDDNIIYTEGHGFGHVSCGNGEAEVAMKLPEMYPVSK
ncbi:GlcG/HbpS family heme-binding protein [Vibrio agarivorans]|uniref:Heme-binding protein n=1 Tax=Vibrio agarivorans TaxID=153622 RepID=A0ABT7Y5Z0_9VIBR|nr:heme-binding protein [Vibrio agarivorans]MDN2483456.1 heme-binding protein [Vibrio agarivorans]